MLPCPLALHLKHTCWPLHCKTAAQTRHCVAGKIVFSMWHAVRLHCIPGAICCTGAASGCGTGVSSFVAAGSLTGGGTKDGADSAGCSVNPAGA